MITVYNETSKPWRFERKKAKSKLIVEGSITRRVSGQQQTRYGVVQNSTPGLIDIPLGRFSKSSIKLKKLKNIKQSQLRGKTVLLSLDNTTTILTKERMTRVLMSSSTKQYSQAYLLVTLDKTNITGRVKVRFNRTQVLDFFDLEREFSAFVGFANHGDSLSFLVNKLDGSYESKTFIYTCVEGKEYIDTIVEEVGKEEYYNGLDKFTKYIPYISTHAVIVHHDDLFKAERMKGRHEFFTYRDIEDLPFIIKKLKDKNYNAVTLYTDTEYRNESDEERVKYKPYIKSLKLEFGIIVKYHKNGFIDRIQAI